MPINLANSPLTKLYLGNTEILKAYLGTIQVFSNSTPLLDTYPSTAAFSLRKLRTAYNGNAVRVRRSSDNAEQNIAFNVNGGLDTTALNTFCTGANGFVTTWYDQQGSNNATQTVQARQPKIYDSVTGVVLENGKHAVSFTKTSSQFLNISTGFALPIFISSVVKANIASNDIGGYFGQGTNRVAFGASKVAFNPLNSFWAWTPNQSCTYGLLNSLDTNQHLHTYYIPDATETNWKWYFDGVDTGSAGLTSGVPTTTSSSAFIGYTGITTEYWNGTIQEIILYNTDQSSNRTGIETNINTYYIIY